MPPDLLHGSLGEFACRVPGSWLPADRAWRGPAPAGCQPRTARQCPQTSTEALLQLPDAEAG